MLKEKADRDFWQRGITLTILLLPVILWAGLLVVVSVADEDWNRSIKSFPEQMEQGRQEMRRELGSLPAEDAAWGRSFVELLEDTNPIFLLTMMILLGAVSIIIFLLTWIISLLYLFFAYYLVRKAT